jgi:hypothetical protein
MIDRTSQPVVIVSGAGRSKLFRHGKGDSMEHGVVRR